MSSSVTAPTAPDGDYGNTQGHCNQCNKVWTLKTGQGICQWCLSAINPGDVDQSADWGGSQGAVTLTVSSSTNVDVNIQIRGVDFSGPGTISIGNVKYDLDSDVAGAGTLDTSYATWYSVTQPLASDDVRQGYHWLSIPGGQAPGTYNSTFYYQAIKSP